MVLMLDTIYNEDCLTGMDRIPDRSVDMILCDLPYGTTQNKWDSVIPLDKLWEQYKRILRRGGNGRAYQSDTIHDRSGEQ